MRLMYCTYEKAGPIAPYWFTQYLCMPQRSQCHAEEKDTMKRPGHSPFLLLQPSDAIAGASCCENWLPRAYLSVAVHLAPFVYASVFYIAPVRNFCSK